MYYESVYPTAITSRYELHQYLAAFREHHGLTESAKIQAAIVGNRMIVRSQFVLPDSKCIQTPTGRVSLYVDYHVKKVRKSGTMVKSYRSENAIARSIVQRCTEHGLTDIDVKFSGEAHIEKVDFKKNGLVFMRVQGVKIDATVVEEQQFERLLLSGIGGRREFGLGMVLVLNNTKGSL